MLEQAESDVLILLDCCAAGSATVEPGGGITEVLGACGFEALAPGVGSHSFTRSLIDELKYMSSRDPFTVTMLHSNLIARIKDWNPRYNSGDCRERRRTPIHNFPKYSNQQSIEITPFQSQISSNRLSFGTSSPPSNCSSSPLSEMTEDIDMISPTSSQSSLNDVWPGVQFKCPRVLISVALKDDQPLRIDEWIAWLSSTPKVAKIEAIYESDSTLMLVSLPVAVWDCLPRNPAISFIKFVRSGNKLKFTQAQTGSITPVQSNKPKYLTFPVDEYLSGASECRRIGEIKCDGDKTQSKPCQSVGVHCLYSPDRAKDIKKVASLRTSRFIETQSLFSFELFSPSKFTSLFRSSSKIPSPFKTSPAKPTDESENRLNKNPAIYLEQRFDPIDCPLTPSTPSRSPSSSFQTTQTTPLTADIFSPTTLKRRLSSIELEYISPPLLEKKNLKWFFY